MANINEKAQLENLENLTDEQLEALEKNLDKGNPDAGSKTGDDKGEADKDVDYKAKYEASQKRAATLQRILNKQGKPENINNLKATVGSDVDKDIAEIKFIHKVEKFARENGLSRSQSEYILATFPSADAETLKQPFVIAGLKAMASKERIENNTPRGRSTSAPVTNKSISEMTPQEKKEWYASKMS